MAFCIMESFTRLKHFDLNDIANNFIRWYDGGFLSSVPGWAFDIGGTTDTLDLKRYFLQRIHYAQHAVAVIHDPRQSNDTGVFNL